MKARIVGACALLIILILFFHGQNSEMAPHQESKPKEVPQIFSKEPTDPVLSDTMLAEYAGHETSGAEDLKIMARYLDSVFLLVKQRDIADYATNEDLVLFLQGRNSHRSPFLASDCPALNDQGQLVDRWDSPLIVHPVSQNLLELRSAGPDTKPYTGDDLTWPNEK